MKGRGALDPEESAFSQLIASVLKEDSSEIPRAQQGNATEKNDQLPQNDCIVNRTCYSLISEDRNNIKWLQMNRRNLAGVGIDMVSNSFSKPRTGRNCGPSFLLLGGLEYRRKVKGKQSKGGEKSQPRENKKQKHVELSQGHRNSTSSQK